MKQVLVRAEIELPLVPDSFQFRHQWIGNGSVSIADCTDDELREVGQEWTERLLARATKLRSESP